MGNFSMKLYERYVLFGSVTYSPCYPFGNVKEQWRIQWSQRGGDDVMTNQWVTKHISLFSENRAKLVWVSWKPIPFKMAPYCSYQWRYSTYLFNLIKSVHVWLGYTPSPVLVFQVIWLVCYLGVLNWWLISPQGVDNACVRKKTKWLA